MRAALAAQSDRDGDPLSDSVVASNRPWRRTSASCPNAERAARELLSLPIDPLMTFGEVDRVCNALLALRAA